VLPVRQRADRQRAESITAVILDQRPDRAHVTR
jgi:hypothetical protein